MHAIMKFLSFNPLAESSKYIWKLYSKYFVLLNEFLIGLLLNEFLILPNEFLKTGIQYSLISP